MFSKMAVGNTGIGEAVSVTLDICSPFLLKIGFS